MSDKVNATVAQRRQLRKFGLTIGIAFLVLTALLFWKERAIWPLFAGLGGLLLALAALWPAGLAPIERVWMKVARVMGWFMTRVILGLVFVLVFTPAGLAIRLLGKDPLELRRGAQADSYWHRRKPRDSLPEKMERMF